MDDVKDRSKSPRGAVSDPPDSTSVLSSSEAVHLDEWKRVRDLAFKQLDRFMSLEPKVLRGDDPPISGRDGLHSQRLVAAVYESARTGERVRIQAC